MAAIVVLSWTLALLAIGAVAVAVFQLLGGLRRLKEAGERAAARVSPLTEELQSELAVTEAEIESLSRTAAARLEQGTQPGG